MKERNFEIFVTEYSKQCETFITLLFKKIPDSLWSGACAPAKYRRFRILTALLGVIPESAGSLRKLPIIPEPISLIAI